MLSKELLQVKSEHYKFQLKQLPYDYSALEPFIDEETVRIHHNKHLKTYVDNLNNILENYPCLHNWPLEKLINKIDKVPAKIRTSVRNNAGGVYNHNFYFDIMTPDSTGEPIGELRDAIVNNFESFENFKKQFIQCGVDQFGSGYAWLVVMSCGKLRIVNSLNQNVPFNLNICPVLLVDVWEHAYYLKYQNRRKDYLENWFNVINWEKANDNYMCAAKRKK